MNCDVKYTKLMVVNNMYDRFIGRNQQITLLKQLMDNKKASLVVIKGRRRIGKSRLAKDFSIRPVLIHVNGVKESVNYEDYFSNIIDFSELLK